MCELGSGVDQDVIGGCDYVSGVNPHHGHRHVGPFAPLLHPHWLVQRPHQITKIAEDSLLSIPVCPSLIGNRETM